MIAVYANDTSAYKKLELAAAMLTYDSPTGTVFHVGETYFDFGQDWKWTTILAESPRHGTYQALDPVDHERILLANGVAEILAAIEEIKKDKFWLDKEEDVK